MYLDPTSQVPGDKLGVQKSCYTSRRSHRSAILTDQQSYTKSIYTPHFDTPPLMQKQHLFRGLFQFKATWLWDALRNFGAVYQPSFMVGFCRTLATVD